MSIIFKLKPLIYAQQIAFSTKETLLFTHACAYELRREPGDFVECGVAAGAQVIAMACAAPNKTIYCFDSFEGIPLASNRDYQQPGIGNLSQKEKEKLPDPGDKSLLKSSGITAISENDFTQHIINSGAWHPNIITIKGWFEETLPNNSIEKISLLRLDGDLYSSTFTCLKYLFKKVINGGIVIIDDFTLKGCREACNDYFKEVNYHPRYQRVSTIAYFIK